MIPTNPSVEKSNPITMSALRALSMAGVTISWRRPCVRCTWHLCYKSIPLCDLVLKCLRDYGDDGDGTSDGDGNYGGDDRSYKF